MMPSGDDAKSIRFDAPLAVPNGTVTAQKNTQIPTTPISAPISGRMNIRWNRPRYASRSSWPSTAEGAGWRCAAVGRVGL